VSASYRIRLAFSQDPDDPGSMPTVIVACDEYTEDAWQGIPEFFNDAIQDNGLDVRTLIVAIPEAVVRELYETPVVDGIVP
jgi:hypothetical protein